MFSNNLGLKKLLLFGSVFISSCSSSIKLPVFYTPAATATHFSYLPRPMQSDSIKSKNYLSASFSNSTLPYMTGAMNMGFINYNRAHVFKKLNVSYGGFTYLGGTSNALEVSNRKVEEDYSHKSFYGAGLRTTVGVAEQFGNVEFRLLNWENSLVFEGGSYSSFMKEIRIEADPLAIASD